MSRPALHVSVVAAVDLSLLWQQVQQGRQFIQTHFWLNVALQACLVLAALVLLYRFLMGRRAEALRARIPILAAWHGRREIRSLRGAGEYAQAGERLVALGQFEEAVKVFQEGNLFGRAADVHLRRKQYEKAALLYERAGEFVKAAEIYVERKQFELAERALEKGGKGEEAGDLFRAKGEKLLAANAYLRSGKNEAAGEMFQELERHTDAAAAYFKAFELHRREGGGLPGESLRPEAVETGSRAARLFRKAGEYSRAGQLFLELGQPREAADCFAQTGDLKRAAELFEKAGDLSRAAEVLVKTGQPGAAARLEGERLAEEGRHLEAVAKFQEAGEFHRAAEIYRDLQEIDKAAAMYERAGEFGLAGSLYREAGRMAQAALAFERGGAFKEAAECYRSADLPEREAAVLEKLGDFVALAELYHRRGLVAEALSALERVETGDPRYRSSLSLRGKIHLDRNEPEQAKECFEKAIDQVERLGSGDIDTIYSLALAGEQTRTGSGALDILEKMLAHDRVEPSAVEKAQNVRKMLTERAFTRASRLQSAVSGGDLFASSEAAVQNLATIPKTKRYIKIKEIGRGGMGIVYTAKDTTLDRTVALKILPRSFKRNRQAVETFLREAKAAAALNHPNIVTVHDAGTQDGDYYIAMEYIEGQTLKEILKTKGKLTPQSAVEVLRQIISALAYAHANNVVHRDLTTNNIMWTKQKGLKIMDFGLAKIVRELLEEQSIIGGTPSYMSPEQTLGKPIDHRTDLYSLGICAYELLFGELPFKGGDLGFHHVNTPPPVPKEKDGRIPDILNTIILRCLEKKPEDRFQSAAEIQALLSGK